MCAGWVGCHDMDENLAVRLAVRFGHMTERVVEKILSYKSPIPLWRSGHEAAMHGISEINNPSAPATKLVAKILKRQREVRGATDPSTSGDA